MGKCVFDKQIVLKIQCLRAIIRDASLHQEAFIRNPLHQKTFVHDVKMRFHYWNSYWKVNVTRKYQRIQANLESFIKISLHQKSARSWNENLHLLLEIVRNSYCSHAIQSKPLASKTSVHEGEHACVEQKFALTIGPRRAIQYQII